MSAALGPSRSLRATPITPPTRVYGWASTATAADLGQAGTETNTINTTYTSSLITSITLINTYAWTQFLPLQKTQIEVAGFVVNPGDRIFVEVWVTGNGLGPDAAFFLFNESTGISHLITTPLAGTQLPLKQAVWIMERPALTAQASGIFGQYNYLPIYPTTAPRLCPMHSRDAATSQEPAESFPTWTR